MEFIQHAETLPLTDDDLRRMLGDDINRCKVIMYEELANATSLIELMPRRNDALIILLHIEGPNAPKVGHWIVMLNQGDHFEHFDSYGMDPDEELATTHEAPYLTQLIASAPHRVETSQAKLQSKKEAVNTCGRWCIVRVRFPQLSKREFVNFIRHVHHIPDVAVTLLTYLL